MNDRVKQSVYFIFTLFGLHIDRITDNPNDVSRRSSSVLPGKSCGKDYNYHDYLIPVPKMLFRIISLNGFRSFS